MFKKVLVLSVLLALSLPAVQAEYGLDGKLEKPTGYLRQSEQMKQLLDTGPKSAQEIAKKAEKSVGAIRLSSGVSATGFFIGKSIFVTNHHVVLEGFPIGSKVIVNGLTYRYSRLLADDPENDIAVIEMKEESFANMTLANMGYDPRSMPRLNDIGKLSKTTMLHTKAISLADTVGTVDTKLSSVPALPLATGDLSVGDTVYLFGSPQGMSGTFSSGMVSAFRKNESLTDTCSYADADIIQYTVPSSPGSSGSPVLNSRGEVVGIHCAGLNGHGMKAENINMAVTLRHLRALLQKAGKYPPA